MANKFYELTVALDEKKTEKDLKGLVEATLEKVGGKLIEFAFWGKKDLIYPIGKRGTVIYGLSRIEVDPAKVLDLSTRLRMHDDVLRSLLVVAAEVKPGKKMRIKIVEPVSEKPAKKVKETKVKETKVKAVAAKAVKVKEEAKETKVSNKKKTK